MFSVQLNCQKDQSKLRRSCDGSSCSESSCIRHIPQMTLHDPCSPQRPQGVSLSSRPERGRGTEAAYWNEFGMGSLSTGRKHLLNYADVVVDET